MDINEALVFATKDPDWIKKFVIGALMAILSFLIIPLFFLIGYMVRITRNVMDGVEYSLPEWDDWGGLLKDGLYLTVAMFVYSLPFLLLMCCAFLFTALGSSAGGDTGDFLAGVGALTIFAVACLGLIWMLLLLVIGPVIVIQYARLDDLSACFQFREIMDLTQENLSDVLISVLVIFGINIAISFLAIIPIIGWIIALAGRIYVIAVTGHLYGQIGGNIAGEKEKDLPAYDL